MPGLACRYRWFDTSPSSCRPMVSSSSSAPSALAASSSGMASAVYFNGQVQVLAGPTGPVHPTGGRGVGQELESHAAWCRAVYRDHLRAGVADGPRRIHQFGVAVDAVGPVSRSTNGDFSPGQSFSEHMYTLKLVMGLRQGIFPGCVRVHSSEQSCT